MYNLFSSYIQTTTRCMDYKQNTVINSIKLLQFRHLILAILYFRKYHVLREYRKKTAVAAVVVVNNDETCLSYEGGRRPMPGWYSKNIVRGRTAASENRLPYL